MKSTKFTTAALALLVAVAGGCSTAMKQQVERDLADDTAEVKAHIASLSSPPPTYRKLDSPFILGEAIQLQPAPSHPAAIDEMFVYRHREEDGLLEAAHYISESSGLRISVTLDATERAAEVLGQSPTSPTRSAGFALHQEAKLSSILDEIASRTGTSWRWTGSEIIIFYRDVRTFRLHAVPPSVQTSGTITNASTTGGGGGAGGGESGGAGESASTTTTGNEQTTTVNYVFDVFLDTSNAIREILSEGSTVAASPSTASIVVRATAPELAAVGRYIDTINLQLTRQIVIEMSVLTVDHRDEDSFAMDVDIVHKTLGGAATSLTGSGGSGLGGGSVGATLLNSSSPFAGSSVLIEALRVQANASVRRRNLITALDNQPTRVQSVVERGYQAGSETIIVPQVGTQTTTIVARQTTGFSLTLLPVVLDKDTILLQVQGGLSIPLERTRVPGGNEELLTTSMDDFVQRARLKTGETLVLTGLDQIDRGHTDQGVGSARFKGLGGSSKTRDAKRMLVILLTVRSVG